ncbi:hypothetical protein JCM10212_005649 [Sporobolomyces blumeae]
MAPDHSYAAHARRYSTAIENGRNLLHELLNQSDHPSWKRVSPRPSTSSSSSTSAAPAPLDPASTSTSRATTTPTTSNPLPANRSTPASTALDPSLVVVHKRPPLAAAPAPAAPLASASSSSSSSSSTSPLESDVFRAVAQVSIAPTVDDREVLERFRVALRTSELRPVWDKLVEHASTLEIVDPSTRVTKTDYRLGWPASPRDTITISRTYSNSIARSPSDPDDSNPCASTSNGQPASNYLIDLSTSLPRSADEPAFLRPAPPYVRTQVGILGWCFEILPTPSSSSSSSSHSSAAPVIGSTASRPPSTREETEAARTASTTAQAKTLRITLFWSWSLRLSPTHLVGTLASAATPHATHVPHLVSSLVNFVLFAPPLASTPGPAPPLPSHLSTSSSSSSIPAPSSSSTPTTALSDPSVSTSLDSSAHPPQRSSTSSSSTTTSVPSSRRDRSPCATTTATTWVSVGPGTDLPPSLQSWGRGIEVSNESWDAAEDKWVGEWAVVHVPAAEEEGTEEDKDKEEERGRQDDHVEEIEGFDDDERDLDLGRRAKDEGKGSASSSSLLLMTTTTMRTRRNDGGRRRCRTVELGIPPPATTGAVGGGKGRGAGLSESGLARGKDGWDVRISIKALGGSVVAGGPPRPPLPPPPSTSTSSDSPSTSTSTSPGATAAFLAREASNPRSTTSTGPPLFTTLVSTLSDSSRHTLRISHAAIPNKQGLARVKVTVMRLVGGKGIRVNGEIVEPRVVGRSRSRGHGDGESETRETGDEGDGADEQDDWSRVLARSRERSNVLSSPSVSRPSASGDAASSSSLLSTSPASFATSSASQSGISLRSTTASTTTTLTLAQHHATQISTLLRRSYIYFLSLLQEPPAKWRHVADASGVSVTQLLSPDPTLTIYRAEAVFVGVGVWDVFATIATASAKKVWDKGVDKVELVRQEDGGELSEVWWEKRKANWPVAARDSVTLRTSYKSPTSVHIFSFSTDDHSLFPHIPPCAPGVIRTQTDLYGWSIESLSPTTTSITLLDQSDPKGWSNKGWTPNQLVQAVAGVRDFTIKNGAPPVVTRLSGGRKRNIEYEHEKGWFKVEYEWSGTRDPPFGVDDAGRDGNAGSLFDSASIDPDRRSVLTTTTTTTDDRASISTEASASTRRQPQIHSPSIRPDSNAAPPIELELRCDVSVWSPSGLEIMVDPPPSSVSCLSRHRLSSGGGLWLTIEHPPAIVESEGKVTVTVRRAQGVARGSEKGGVSINGARVRVDVEVLEEEKVRELEGRKRKKISPIPLDQYETLGARVWTGGGAGAGAGAGGGGAAGAGAGAGGNAPAQAGTPLAATARGGSLSTLPEGEDGKVGARSAGGSKEDSTTSATLGGKASSVPSVDGATDALEDNGPSSSTSGVEPTVPMTKPPLEPPAAALEALAYLQSFHAEQGPELTDPAPGWSIVSERGGTVVRKKIVPRISDVFPVYRGDKIVQGLTADEMASVVTSPGCRRVWDERVDQAVPLASFGNGISTLAISTKPAFPFKARIFYVATVVASVKVPSASSTSSTSTVVFVASASYTPRADSDPFDPARINPSSLLGGEVLLEGWILETLDPYTSSVLAIPSTRCTYLAAIDQKGSVPLALNQVLNANLAKSIGNVETFGKTKGPLPRIWSPSPGVQIEGPLSEDGEGDCVWRLTTSRNEGPSRVVCSNYGDEENTFRALFRVAAKTSIGSKDDETDRQAGDKQEAGSGRAKGAPSASTGTTNKSLSVGSTLLKSELPRSASFNFGTAAPPVLHKSSATSELSHRKSRGSLRSKSPAAPPIATGAPPSVAPAAPGLSNPASVDAAAQDIVVAEFVVDLKQYPHGYSILTNSNLLPSPDVAAPFDPLSLEPLPPRSLAPSSSSSPSLPLRVTAHDAPLPSILTASLDAWKRANHLVRVLVPTSPITHPLQDPLRDPAQTKTDKPEWFKLLVDGGGALVEVKIVPLPAPAPSAPLSDRERSLATTSTTTTTSGGVEATGLGRVTGQAARTVMFNGEKVVVISQKDSRSVLARFEDEDAPLQGAKISRVPRRKRKSTAPDDSSPSASSSLPLGLQQPLAIAVRLLAPKPTTPVVDDFEFPDPKSPGVMTPAVQDGGGSPVMTKTGSVSSASNRRGTATSDSTPISGPLSAILGSYPLARFGSSIVNATTPAPDSSTPDGAISTRRGYSLEFVLAVAIIAFLLGSLLRSLLTPADYIVYLPGSVPSPAATDMATDTVEKALLTAFDPRRRWREAKRLLELRSPWIRLVGWDLIVAAVKRE